MTETSAVHNHAQEASCNKNDKSVISETDSMTETSAVYDHAQKASCVMSETNSMTKTSAVHNLYTQEASCNENDKSVISETDSMTETSAVYNLYTQEASCVILKEISDITEAHTV